VLVPAAITLRGLHRVIQAAMGWQDYHLHVFRIGDAAYGPDPENELGFRDETRARLCDAAQVGTRIGYEYDFGDAWDHELVVEAAFPGRGRSGIPSVHRRPRAPARRRIAAARPVIRS
jgi:hypothetical protein